MAGSKPLVRQGGRTQQGNISIESVTGLSGELGAKVSDDDSRLTDSREWSEATVTQEEAEAGTASTRRAWTAQRVWQAINAWWQLVTSGFGRNFINASNEQAARNVLQLGAAATRDVGVSSGEVLIVQGGTTFGNGKQVSSWPTPTTTSENVSMFGRSVTEQYGIPAYTAAVHFSGGSDTWGRLSASHNSYRAWIQGGRVTGNTYWTAELIHTGNIQSTTGQSTEYPMSQKAVTDALDNIDVSGPRPTKDHGAVATAGSQTVVCNVQESDFHIMSMETANTTGTLTIDFANMPDTVGKHFSWHVRLRRGGQKAVAFAQTVTWAGGVAPSFGTGTSSYDLIMFYKVDDETIRGMVVDAW